MLIFSCLTLYCCSIFNHNGKTALNVAIDNNHQDCAVFLEQASCSQHTSFFPSASSPILMNGEGIYQRQKSQSVELAAPVNGNDQDMEMEEGAACSGGDAMNFCSPLSGVKRSFDDEEEHTFKRQRLFGEDSGKALWLLADTYIIYRCRGLDILDRASCFTVVFVMGSGFVLHWNYIGVYILGWGLILRVSDQNGVFQAWYIVEIHHSGWKPLICERKNPSS